MEEARRSLRRVLALRFPGLENAPELEALLDQTLTAPDASSTLSAIRRARQK